MATKLITGSFSEGFRVTAINSDARSIEFRELVMDYGEELGFDDQRIAQELRHLLDLLCQRNETAEHVAELERRRNTAIRQPR